MKTYNLGFIGFGNVGKALARLLATKANDLREVYGIETRITGVASRSLGWLVNSAGLAAIDPSQLLNDAKRADGPIDWIRQAKPDVVFETTSLNHETGQPAIEYLSAALKAGAHAITANKGAVVYGYPELNQLANAAGKRFFFEATVLDSAPVFSLFRETLPAVKLRGLTGVFNSTSNVVLESMEAGRSFAEGVKMAQELGVAETDSSHDVDGWDSTVKICALANVLMGMRLTPADVRREGIRDLTTRALQAARAEGKPYKLMARAKFADDKLVSATVKPEQVALTEPLGNVRGTSLAVHFELDMMPGLTITSHRPNLQSTAYGLLADFINAVKQ
jgi:homoserine dehydrogenase